MCSGCSCVIARVSSLPEVDLRDVVVTLNVTTFVVLAVLLDVVLVRLLAVVVHVRGVVAGSVVSLADALYVRCVCVKRWCLSQGVVRL